MKAKKGLKGLLTEKNVTSGLSLLAGLTGGAAGAVTLQPEIAVPSIVAGIVGVFGVRWLKGNTLTIVKWLLIALTVILLIFVVGFVGFVYFLTHL